MIACLYLGKMRKKLSCPQTVPTVDNMTSKQLQGKLTLQKVKQALRNPYAWPGGYPIQMWAYDGCICHKCIRANFRAVVADTKSGFGGWDIRGVDVLWEGPEWCAQCGDEIETAYGSEAEVEL